ncbi:hypothetical protein K431DRAFT_282347 [Polychaeton citri CBS 116435]|uniref:Uncharacterized protein n=1 Tax=Polychaeton citri CBS 116435 TaxID=1314669 RepID=A0A9P4USW0_9PEZI|nr:hypothetical protein K431DRAFT_282347 [Polychaeton citri CBS 116435]
MPSTSSLRTPQLAHIALILPLCTSSVSVGLSLFQYPLFLSFLKPGDQPNTSNKSIAGKPLTRFWAPFVKSGGALVVNTCLTSAAAGLFASRWLRSHKTLETTNIGNWYFYGALFAAGHLLFAPIVSGPVGRIASVGCESHDNEEEVDAWNRKEMKRWLNWHTIRTLVVDLPALICFAEGAAQSFWVI